MRLAGIIGFLCTSDYTPEDTLHKKPCRIGPELCGTSETTHSTTSGE
jgi:hypothetical protein